MVHTLPAVALLKRHWPASRIRWLINPEWAPLLDGNPTVDEVVIFPRGQFRGLAGWGRILPWAKSLGRVNSELVVDFQGLLRSALIARICRGGEVIGLSDAREGARFFYDRVADVRGIAHAVDRYLSLVARLGLDVKDAPLEWPLPAGSAPAGFALTPFVLLHPFSRGAGKSMNVESVVDLCHALAPLRVVIAGRADEELPALDHVTNLLNRTSLAELIWLIRHASFVISVDSGPMHIAAALTPRLISIHTWSDPRKVGPYSREAWVWQNGRIFRQGEDGEQLAGLRELASFVARQVMEGRAAARPED